MPSTLLGEALPGKFRPRLANGALSAPREPCLRYLDAKAAICAGDWAWAPTPRTLANFTERPVPPNEEPDVLREVFGVVLDQSSPSSVPTRGPAALTEHAPVLERLAGLRCGQRLGNGDSTTSAPWYASSEPDLAEATRASPASSSNSGRVPCRITASATSAP